MSAQVALRIEGLLKERGNDAALEAWRERQATKSRTEEDSRRKPPTLDAANPSAAEAASVPPSAVPAELSETLEQQNELLRAILASSVDTQTDARATAQNSRTFAWAGTAIALLTLIATVISIVTAVQAH
jgi:hypothetical protein